MKILPIFVTGTGTDVGKTYVAAALCLGLKKSGFHVHYWKPVQTGPLPGDSHRVQEIAGVNIWDKCWYYAPALSPDQAAQQSGAAQIQVADVEQAFLAQCGTLAADTKHAVVIEGAGGLYVPLNDQGQTWIDVIQALRTKVVIASHGKLGTINHTSLTLETCKRAALDVSAVVFSGELQPLNQVSLQNLWPDVVFKHLPIWETLSAAEKVKHCEHLAGAVCDKSVHAQRDMERFAATRTADAKHVWHPFTQHSSGPEPLIATRAKGSWIYTSEGTKLFDGISSWWTNTIGHGRVEMAETIKSAQQTLDQVIFAGFTHEPAALLAEELTALAGAPLTRCFFSDNGSTSVEVGLKMAFQYWVNQGERQRTTFATLKGSYHGDTMGAMSVAGSSFGSVFAPILFKPLPLTAPTIHRSYLCPEGLAAAATLKEQALHTLRTHEKHLAALIIEPLLLGAGGMLVTCPDWLKDIVNEAQQLGIPVIFDEVLTGFGRVGRLFAAHQAGIQPDIMCLSKGITGGTFPLGVTLASEKIFEAFSGSSMEKAFLHGHSYTANPIICAAARTALSITQKEELPAKASAMQEIFSQWLACAAAEFHVENPRAIGGVLAFEWPGSGFGNYHHPAISQRIKEAAWQHGLLLRPLGNTLYLMPPLSTPPDELSWALESLRQLVHDVAKSL